MKRRIAVMGWNSATQYSGGRYHAWLMAHALAHSGHNVTFITNNVPLFARDFAVYPAGRRLKVHLSENFRSWLPRGAFDLVIMIPHMQRDPRFFLNVRHFAATRGGHLASLNFETPNWFNAMAPQPRSLAGYAYWKQCCAEADVLISSARESVKHAREYFADSPALRHLHCHPSINSVLADHVPDAPREKRILLFGRFVPGDAHKGSTMVDKLFCEAMRGYTLVMVIGAADRRPAQAADWEREAAAHGIRLELLYKLTDAEKFREIKRSTLVLFPSFFEGFGLPPVEAQYCNTPCIAFDLPVIRETSGDGVHYVPRGDWDAFREKIAEVLVQSDAPCDLRGAIETIASFEAYAARMDGVVEAILEQPRRTRTPIPWQETWRAVWLRV